tara:strand:- start:36365 stop:37375 length:1011 start_codon:yes stop_codon:yes gene_type:complete
MERIIDEFLNYKDDHNKNTKTSYSADLILFSNYLKLNNIKSIYKVTPKNIEEFFTSNFLNTYQRTWKNKKGEATKSIKGERSLSSKNRIISTLSSFYKYLVFKEKVSHSPIPKRSTKNEVKSQSLGKKEVQIILDFLKRKSFSKFPMRDRLIIELLYYCGLRVSELIKIKVEDLKLYNENPYVIIQGKGNKFRDQPIPSIMLENLYSYIEIERESILSNKDDSKFLLISNYGSTKSNKYKNLTRQQINQIVTKVSYSSLSEFSLSNKKSGKTKYKKISPHMFRHAIGTHLHKSGIDILRVRDHLGHSSVSTTSRYVGKEKEKTSILNKYGPLSKKF